MRLVRLAAEHFRNLAPLELDTNGQFVVLSGDNAQGKTNTLEAVYALATLKPLRGHRLTDTVSWDAEDATVTGIVDAGAGERTLRLQCGRSRRRVWLDGDEVRDLEAYFMAVRAIGFTPHDGTIVTGEPKLRRRWLDRAAFTAQPAHLERVRRYRRVLQQKSAVLKQPPVDAVLLDALDEQLAEAGARLADHRARMIEELRPHILAQHQEIAGGYQALNLRYVTVAKGSSVQERAASLAGALREARPSETRRRMCMVGPQKDDVRVMLDGKLARHYGSRGQVRSIVLSMKLAELVAARARGDHPLFLLDDLSSELDRSRTQRLVTLLSALEAQVFITTTDVGHLGGLPRDETRYYRVETGQITVSSQR